jgi:hypothetical protein
MFQEEIVARHWPGEDQKHSVTSNNRCAAYLGMQEEIMNEFGLNLSTELLERGK